MTLAKAIEILSDSAYAGITTFDQDFKDAQKLLILAGRRLITLRSYNIGAAICRLPGETRD